MQRLPSLPLSRVRVSSSSTFHCQQEFHGMMVVWCLVPSDQAMCLRLGPLVCPWCCEWTWGCPQSGGLLETPSSEVSMTPVRTKTRRSSRTGQRVKLRA